MSALERSYLAAEQLSAAVASVKLVDVSPADRVALPGRVRSDIATDDEAEMWAALSSGEQTILVTAELIRRLGAVLCEVDEDYQRAIVDALLHTVTPPTLPSGGSLRLTVLDIDSGAFDEVVVGPGEFHVVAQAPAKVTSREAFGTGELVLIVEQGRPV